MPVNQKEQDYQSIYNDENSEPLKRDEALLASFENLNKAYGYFKAPLDIDTQDECLRFFNFFNAINLIEGNKPSIAEVLLYTYKATVLLGGVRKESACKVLQRLVNEGYKENTKPIHDAFSTLTLPINAPDLNLTLWRKWINGPNTRKALKQFDSASDIANQFGPIDGYTLKISSINITTKNAEEDTLYLHQGKHEPSKIAFTFKDCNGSLHFGKLERNDLPPYDDIMTAITTKEPLTLDQETRVFNTINKKHPNLRREVRFEEINRLQAKLVYQRFDEKPELGALFHQYHKSESIFNQGIALLSKQKTSDNLPNITIDGHDSGHEGYHLVKLPLNDPRALLLGDITNCCQSIGGESEQSVIDGWTLPNNGFYVLLKSKKDTAAEPLNASGINDEEYDIVGQSYAWRSLLGNLVFDSWENLRPQSEDEIAVTMLTDFAQKVVSNPEHSICRVMIGLGGRTPDSLKTQRSSDVESIAYGVNYGDANCQSELASRSLGTWKNEVTASIDTFTELRAVDKKTLIEEAPPMASGYVAMLTHYLRPLHPWIKRVFESQNAQERTEVLKALTILHTSFSDEIQSETIKHIEKQQTLPLGIVNEVITYARKRYVAQELYDLLRETDSLLNDTTKEKMMTHSNLSLIIEWVDFLKREGLLSNDKAGLATLTALLEQHALSYSRSIMGLLVTKSTLLDNVAHLLSGDASRQESLTAVLNSLVPNDTTEVLSILKQAGLLSNDETGKNNRAAIVQFQDSKIEKVRLAFQILNKAGLVHNDAASRANLTAVLEAKFPTDVASALATLNETGLLSTDEAGEKNRSRVLLHTKSIEAAEALAYLSKKDVLINDEIRTMVLGSKEQENNLPMYASITLAYLNEAGLFNSDVAVLAARGQTVARGLAALNKAGLAGEQNQTAVMSMNFNELRWTIQALEQLTTLPGSQNPDSIAASRDELKKLGINIEQNLNQNDRAPKNKPTDYGFYKSTVQESLDKKENDPSYLSHKP